MIPLKKNMCGTWAAYCGIQVMGSIQVMWTIMRGIAGDCVKCSRIFQKARAWFTDRNTAHVPKVKATNTGYIMVCIYIICIYIYIYIICIHIYIYIYIWRFPEIGVPPNHPFQWYFPLTTIHLGVPPFMDVYLYLMVSAPCTDAAGFMWPEWCRLHFTFDRMFWECLGIWVALIFWHSVVVVSLDRLWMNTSQPGTHSWSDLMVCLEEVHR